MTTLHDRWIASPEGQAADAAADAAAAAYAAAYDIYLAKCDAWMAGHEGDES